MTIFQKIETTAKSIIKICKKEQIKSGDRDRLLKLQGEIFSAIESLSECDLCGTIDDPIAEILINDVKAKLCRSCGITALERGEIRKKTTRKPTRRRTTKKSTAVKPKTKIVNLHGEIEEKTGLKKTEIKKIEKLISEIPTPMNLENTTDYVIREAEIAKLKIDEAILRQTVEMILKSQNS